MSGGYFDYKQHALNDIESSLQECGWSIYPDDIKEDIIKTIELLQECSVRVQRLDWFFSGDDGEESYRERLTDELKEIDKLPR